MAASLFELCDFPRRFLSAPVFLQVSSARASPRHVDQPKAWDSCTPEHLAQKRERMRRHKQTAKQQSQKATNEVESGISSGRLPSFTPLQPRRRMVLYAPVTLTAKNFVFYLFAPGRA